MIEQINDTVFFLDEWYMTLEAGIIEKIEDDTYLVRCRDGFLLRIKQSQCFAKREDMLKEIERKK